MIKPFEFTAEDFVGVIFDDSECRHAAHIANAKLQEWLKDAPVVYGASCPDGFSPWTARLVDIREEDAEDKAREALKKLEEK